MGGGGTPFFFFFFFGGGDIWVFFVKKLVLVLFVSPASGMARYRDPVFRTYMRPP